MLYFFSLSDLICLGSLLVFDGLLICMSVPALLIKILRIIIAGPGAITDGLKDSILDLESASDSAGPSWEFLPPNLPDPFG